jgi:hypothetical protein
MNFAGYLIIDILHMKKQRTFYKKIGIFAVGFCSCLSFFLLYCVRINCQELPAKSRNSIDRILEKEIQNYTAENCNVIPVNIALPGDFCTPLPQENNKITVIGISDPELDSLAGKEQALLRALTIFSLKKAAFNGMSDYYQQEAIKNVNNKYEELYRITACCTLSSGQIHQISTQHLQSGEYICRIAVDTIPEKTSDSLHLKAVIDLYHKEAIIDGKPQSIYKTEIVTAVTGAKNQNELFSFTFVNERWINLVSEFNKQPSTHGNYRFFYQTTQGQCSDTTGWYSSGWSTLDGIWPPLMNSLLWQLTSNLKENYQQIKKVEDVYMQKNTELNRESGGNAFQLRLQNIAFVQNKIYTLIRVNLP